MSAIHDEIRNRYRYEHRKTLVATSTDLPALFDRNLLRFLEFADRQPLVGGIGMFAALLAAGAGLSALHVATGGILLPLGLLVTAAATVVVCELNIAKRTEVSLNLGIKNGSLVAKYNSELQSKMDQMVPDLEKAGLAKTAPVASSFECAACRNKLKPAQTVPSSIPNIPGY